MKLEVVRYRATGVWRWDTKPPPSAASAASAKKKKKKEEPPPAEVVEVDDDEEEVCGICRQAFDETCPDCLTPGDDCPPVWGVCLHMFHVHCIVKWIDSANDAQSGTHEERRQCPMCRVVWEFRAD